LVHFDDELIARELHNNSVEISSEDATEIEEIEDSSDIESEEYIPNGSEVLEMINKVKKYFHSQEDISHKIFKTIITSRSNLNLIFSIFTIILYKIDY